MAHRPKFSPTNRMLTIMVLIPFQSLYLTEMRMIPSPSISPSIPVDDPAVISGDTSGVLNEDSSVTGDLNAIDIEGLTDGSYFSISSTATNGTSSIDATDGNWTYSPSSNFYGTDSFTVTITDDDGNTSTQLISLTINPVDDPSVISGDTIRHYQ